MHTYTLRAFRDEFEKIANFLAAKKAENPALIGNRAATAGGAPRIWNHGTLPEATRYAKTLPAGRPRLEYMHTLATDKAPHLIKGKNWMKAVNTMSSKLTKMAGTPAEEANKLLGIPLDGRKPGTQSYEQKQMKDEEHAQEAQVVQEQQAMEAAAAMPPPKPKKPAKKKDGDKKVKVEVKVDGKKSDAKVSEPKKKSEKKD